MIAAGVLERGEFYHKTLYNGHFWRVYKKRDLHNQGRDVCGMERTSTYMRIQVHTHQARLRVVKRRS